jgi:hypothetical protein
MLDRPREVERAYQGGRGCWEGAMVGLRDTMELSAVGVLYRLFGTFCCWEARRWTGRDGADFLGLGHLSAGYTAVS